MEKSKPSVTMYAIAAGFVVISVLQIVHAIMGLPNLKNFSATAQTAKTIKTIGKPDLIVPGTRIQLGRGR